MNLPIRRLGLEVKFLKNEVLEQFLIAYRQNKAENHVVGSGLDEIRTGKLKEIQDATFRAYATGARVPGQIT